MPPADSSAPPPAPGGPPAANATPTDVVRREELERALSEIDRLMRETKDHATTRSTAERQAADLQTLRKYHEKAHAEIEKLKAEKAVLAAEKETMSKRAAAALEDRRRREKAEADAEKLKHETRKFESEKVALEKKVADQEALKAAHEQALAEVARLKEEVKRLEARAGGIPDVATPRLSAASVLPETKAMPAVPPAGAAPETLPMPPIDLGEPGRPVEKKSNAPAVSGAHASSAPEAGDRIKYKCAGCDRKLGAPPEFAGTFGTCRFCGHRMQVPLKSSR